ncbi:MULTISPECIES: contact-dependent growth inhibition system immunity protein [unclassified Pseudomonas]|uniref:contact-dependent growth inhibition system immunity protein n=1 Tax=unclassified Pseudomonas TaxID=196821 RepID=UPI00286D6C98|nr:MULTISPECIES: contact-dependent growth inhibition system immunity protein [unclassified Pseudomonas]
MSPALTILQQFLGGYFNQDWVYEHDSADEVIDSFINESAPETLCQVRQEIIELLAVQNTEIDLQQNLFCEQYCYYHYLHEWTSGQLWLEHVIRKLDAALTERTEKGGKIERINGPLYRPHTICSHLVSRKFFSGTSNR